VAIQLDRQTAQDRLDEGKAAYEAGDPSDACPYAMTGTREDRFGYHYWIRGWSMARSEAEAKTAPASTGQ
jgi:ribosome modulation factor